MFKKESGKGNVDLLNRDVLGPGDNLLTYSSLSLLSLSVNNRRASLFVYLKIQWEILPSLTAATTTD